MSFGFGFGFPKRLTSGGGLSPRLYLDFIGTGSLPSTVTFSRGTNATLTDSNGRVAWAPHNLLTNSEDFEAAAWTKSGLNAFGSGSTSNSTVAPDGTTTADFLQENSAASNHGVSLLYTYAGGPHTLSLYAKAGGRSRIELSLDSADAQAYASFNLTGAGSTINVGTGASAVITAVGNDWYRCAVTYAPTAGVKTIRTRSGDSVNDYFYTGNGTSGIFIWGAQLNVGALQSYNSTTPKNLLGFTQEFDNAAWTKSNSFVQTNLLTWSEQFNNAAWTLDNSGAVNPVVTADAGAAPNGTVTADRIVLNKTGGVFSRIQQGVLSSIGTVYTFSVWMKTFAGDTSNVGIRIDVISANCVVTGDWQRFTVSTTATALSTAGQILLFDSIVGNDETADILVWGAQLVQGSVPGDYQVTTSAAAAVQYSDPNGTRTADKVVATATSGYHGVRQSFTYITGTRYTLSVYARAAEYSNLYISDLSSGTMACAFDLQAGTAGTPRPAPFTSVVASIQNVGGGWYRCSLTGTSNTSATTTPTFVGYPAGATLDDNGAFYTGDGTSGIYIWGAQLSNSASVDPYVYNPQAAPTSTAFYGPRFDYNPTTLAANGLLIEEQRTNLFTYSQDFSNAFWQPTNITVTNSATTAPDGTNTAQSIAATAAVSTLFVSAATTVAATSATYSIYVKQGSGANLANTFLLRNNTTATNLLGGTINYSTGAFTYSVGSTGVTVQNVGNSWWRIVMTVTSGVTAGDGLRGYIGFTGGTETAGTFLYAWGAQLEAGSFATSYIPTVASQVTRNADSASMLGDNFYTWYNPNQGTLSGEASRPALGGNSPIATVFSATNTRMQVGNNTGGGGTAEADFYVQNAGADQAWLRFASAVTANVPFKIVGAYNLNNFGASANGAATLTDTSGTVPVATSFLIGASGSAGNAFNGTIRRIGYYNTRLPDSTLQALTV